MPSAIATGTASLMLGSYVFAIYYSYVFGKTLLSVSGTVSIYGVRRELSRPHPPQKMQTQEISFIIVTV